MWTSGDPFFENVGSGSTFDSGEAEGFFSKVFSREERCAIGLRIGDVMRTLIGNLRTVFDFQLAETGQKLQWRNARKKGPPGLCHGGLRDFQHPLTALSGKIPAQPTAARHRRYQWLLGHNCRNEIGSGSPLGTALSATVSATCTL